MGKVPSFAGPIHRECNTRTTYLESHPLLLTGSQNRSLWAKMKKAELEIKLG
jgi:hypothetical protein